jgi:hypothetical protein
MLFSDGIRGCTLKNELILIQRSFVLLRAVSTAILYYSCEETKLGS